VAKHVGAADTAPLRLIGTENRPEIAEPRCAEQRIAQRVSSDIAIRMPGAAVSVGKQQAQQPTRPPNLYGVYIGAKTDTQHEVP
jgi:hypothetical protein